MNTGAQDYLGTVQSSKVQLLYHRQQPTLSNPTKQLDPYTLQEVFHKTKSTYVLYFPTARKWTHT